MILVWDGNTFGGRPNGGPGAEAPGGQRIFENLQKISLENCEMHYFSLFFKKFNNPCVKFSSVWTKNTICLANFEKLLQIFDENSIKNRIFIYFCEKLMV